MKDRFLITDTFIECISSFDKGVKASLWKCLHLLSKNFFHPSLNTEKLNGIYSSRININYRLIHEPLGRLFRLLFAGKHEDAYRFANNYRQQIEAFKQVEGFEENMSVRKYRMLEEPAEMSFKDETMEKVYRKSKSPSLIARLIERVRRHKAKEELAPYQFYSIQKLKKFLK